jgi:ubiquinone/menaquinone biosynthesis C-methylase UbiE
MIEIRHPLTDDVRSAYDDIYSSTPIVQRDYFYQWLLERLRPERGKRLLDVSCGVGMLLRFAREAGLQACGVDISRAAVKAATARDPPARVAVGNGETLPYADESFDYVTNIGSLEHFEHMPEGVREMARVLRQDGRACILLPNSFGLLWNITTVWHTGDVCDDNQPIQRYGTRRQWQQLLEDNGLAVRQLFGYHRALPRTRRDWLWYLRRPHKLLASLLVIPLIPLNLASNLVFICEKGVSPQSTQRLFV